MKKLFFLCTLCMIGILISVATCSYSSNAPPCKTEFAKASPDNYVFIVNATMQVMELSYNSHTEYLYVSFDRTVELCSYAQEVAFVRKIGLVYSFEFTSNPAISKTYNIVILRNYPVNDLSADCSHISWGDVNKFV